jgi:hypothetical protein
MGIESHLAARYRPVDIASKGKQGTPSSRTCDRTAKPFANRHLVRGFAKLPAIKHDSAEYISEDREGLIPAPWRNTRPTRNKNRLLSPCSAVYLLMIPTCSTRSESV